MKKMIQGVALAVLVMLVAAQAAQARNFHVAGGIQYVIQGTKEKEKGNMEDAQRIFGKAVRELSIGVKEDPKDNEAWGYLGQAYGELDSCSQAGAAFAEAMTRLADNPKTLDRVKGNRDYYRINAYNKGIEKLNEAKAIMPLEDIPNSKDPIADQAKAKLEEAAGFFRCSVSVDPSQSDPWNNLAVTYALQGKFDQATAVVNEGLSHLPNDEKLKVRKEGMYTNAVLELLKVNDYEGALTMLNAAIERNPKDFNALSSAAQTSYEWGQKLQEAKDEAGAKAKFAMAQDYFGRAAEAAPDAKAAHDIRYNQGVAAQNAGDPKAAAKVFFALVQDDPKDMEMHKMLRSAYDKMGSSKKANDEIWVILGMNDKSTPVADVAAYTAAAPQASGAAKVLAEHGAPDEVRQFTSENTSVDIWYYWPKKRVFAFSKSQLAGEANFGEFGPEEGDQAKAPAGGAKAPAKKPASKPAATGSKG